MKDKEYKIIGEYVAVQSALYANAEDANAKLVAERFRIDKEIHDAELAKDEIKLNSLYDEYRQNKADIEANRCFRENLAHKVLVRVNKALNQTEKEIGIVLNEE